MVKQCIVCGREFEWFHGGKKYCSPECRKQAYRLKRKRYGRDYYQRHREESLAKAKAYYHANKDEILRKRNEGKTGSRKQRRKHEPDFYKRLDQCCKRHGGIDNCPYEDCVCE